MGKTNKRQKEENDMTKNNGLIKLLSEHKRDAVLILSLILISVIMLVAFSLLRGSGDHVQVELDGELVASYPLDRDGEYPIGEGNILAIEDGEAYMKHADCPDKTCMRSRAISKRGQSIICLPNKVAVSVVISDGAPDTDPDGVDMVS